MSITLDGIVLNNSMVWTERYHENMNVMNMRRTLGGFPVFQVGRYPSGRFITLEAGQDYGWLKKSVVDQVIAISQVPDGIYVLDFNGTDYSIRFDFTNGAAVEMVPLIPRTGDSPDDYFIGSIKLIIL